MQCLWIDCGEELACLRPVRLGVLPNLEVLLGAVQAYRAQYANFYWLVKSPDWLRVLGLLQKIADLHERVDRPGEFGFPVNQVVESELDLLFFQDGGTLSELNKAKQLDSGTKQQPDDFPPWAAEDLVDNWLADLTYSLNGSFREAYALIQSRDLNSIAAISKRLGDLWKGKEKRQEDGLRGWFHEVWEKENQDLLADALFGEA
jgi:hypothetical protein